MYVWLCDVSETTRKLIMNSNDRVVKYLAEVAESIPREFVGLKAAVIREQPSMHDVFLCVDLGNVPHDKPDAVTLGVYFMKHGDEAVVTANVAWEDYPFDIVNGSFRDRPVPLNIE